MFINIDDINANGEAERKTISRMRNGSATLGVKLE
jgi:hypothetical protein